MYLPTNTKYFTFHTEEHPKGMKYGECPEFTKNL